MRTLLFVLALAFLLLPPVFGQAQEATPPSIQKEAPKDQGKANDDQEKVTNQDKVPTYRKNVNLVNVLFNVKDKHGTYVPNLEKDRFELLEEGKPQTIKYFSALTDQPLTIGLL